MANETKAQLEQKVASLEQQAQEQAALSADLTAKVADQEATIKEQEELIYALNQQIEETAAAKPVAVSADVEVDGEAYEITAPRFNFNGQVYTAADVMADAELAAELVKAGAGVLKKKDVQ